MIAPSKLALGTVQFGLAYGATHRGGRVSDAEVEAILARAAAAGIDTLDTASAYGESEAVIGQAGSTGFQIVTKTWPVRSPVFDAAAETEVALRFEQSLVKLRRARVDALLAHDSQDLLCGGGGRLWALMQRWKEQGRAGKIGVSVYDADELEAVLARFPVEIVQLPLNVLDQRFARSGMLAKLQKAGIEAHARSVFLQGLLLIAPDDTPPRLAHLKPWLRNWQAACAAAGAQPLAAALAFAAGQPGVTRAVIGVQSAAHLDEVLTAAGAGAALDWGAHACDDATATDPRRWQRE